VAEHLADALIETMSTGEARRILLECAKWDPKGSTGDRQHLRNPKDTILVSSIRRAPR